MFLRADTKLTRRDLPAVFLIYSALFAVAAFALPFGASLDVVKESDLQTVAGSVQSAPRIRNGGKGGIKLHIFVRASDGLHHLTQDDLSGDVPSIMDLRAGDNVTARVKHDSLGRNLDWLWELKRDGDTILSYEETRRYLERRNARIGKIVPWVGAISFGLFVTALLLRRHFGAWRDATSRSVLNPTRI
jgi:hypothetical protein